MAITVYFGEASFTSALYNQVVAGLEQAGAGAPQGRALSRQFWGPKQPSDLPMCGNPRRHSTSSAKR